MPAARTRVVLLVEGEGDRAAVPQLVRQMVQHLGLFNIDTASRPIRCGNLRDLERPGKLERLVALACERPDADLVLIVLDCDDDCPAVVSGRFAERLGPIARRFSKKVGLAFLRREFETLFLFSLESLGRRFPESNWQLETFDKSREIEEIRGAKEKLQHLIRGPKYKETRDQVRFVTALDFDLLAQRSRSYRHLETTLRWLAQPPDATSWVYPPPRSE